MSWRPHQLRELCLQVASGGTPSTTQSHYYGGEIPWLRTQEVNFNRITDTEIKITEDGLNNSAAKWIPENSVIVAMYGNSAGRVAVNNIPLTTNQACCNLIVDHDKADYRFLYYRLLLDYDVLHQMAKGSAQNNLNAGQIKEYSINTPLSDNQHRIADILWSYDDLIENNRRRIQLLEESARLLYKEWFVHLRFPGHEHINIVHGVPEGWKKVTLRNICSEVKDIINPQRIEPDIPYIGLEHIPRKSITLTDWGTANEVSSTKHKYSESDILFGKIRSYFHKVGFTLTDGIASSDAIVIRPLNIELWPITLMSTSSDHFVNVSAKTAKEGSKMPRADWKHMQTYPLLLPPKPVLLSFNESIFNITSMLKSLALQNRKLAQARDLLLPRLMNGEISV